MQAVRTMECSFLHQTLLRIQNAVETMLQVEQCKTTARGFALCYWFYLKPGSFFSVHQTSAWLPISCFVLQCDAKASLSLEANVSMIVFNVSITPEYPPAHGTALRSQHLSRDCHQCGAFSQHGYAF